MLPALAQVCSLNSPLEADIEDYAAGQCRVIELWWGKVDAYLDAHSPRDLTDLLAEHEMLAPVISFQGGLLTTQGDFRKEQWDLYARRLELCQQLGIGTMVLAGDLYGDFDEPALERARVSLTQAAAHAGVHRVRLALEFQGRASFANNLQTAAAIVNDAASPHLGLCLDMFHYYIGPSKPEDFGYLARESLFHVQVSDLAGVAREVAADADRVLPGDGDFHFEPLIERLRQIEYAGYVSLELMNPQIWQVPPRQFGEIGITALRKLLGQAGME